MFTDEMFDKFLDISYKVGKSIKLLFHSNLKRKMFHYPSYIKNLIKEKHLAYNNIKHYLIVPMLILILIN